MNKPVRLSLSIMLVLLWALSFEPVLNEAGAGVFKITRLQLYFANQRAETVVDKNDPALKAYADITSVGSGLLQGFWEVDGRILASVNRHITSERTTVTIETPDIPGIPTFESGTHRLRLVVTSPALPAILPEAIYFVAGQPVRPLPFKIKEPAAGAEIPYAPTFFSWEGQAGSAAHLITFFGPDKKPVFSAYTRDLDYKITAPILESSFLPGREYFWKVVSFGEEQDQLGASPLMKFRFRDR
jgi:hypothetical protein